MTPVFSIDGTPILAGVIADFPAFELFPEMVARAIGIVVCGAMADGHWGERVVAAMHTEDGRRRLAGIAWSQIAGREVGIVGEPK